MLGNTSAKYRAIYERVSTLLSAQQLLLLQGFEQPMQAHAEPAQRMRIASQIAEALRVLENGSSEHAWSHVPKQLRSLMRDWEGETFPQFQALVFKRQGQSAGRRRLARSSA